MARLHIVRHGQTVWNLEHRMQGRENSPLTEKGKEQANRACQKLDKFSFSAAYTSSSGRAVETAEIILKNRDISAIHDTSLMEIALGEYEGRLVDDINTESPGVMEDFFERPEMFVARGGESFEQLIARAWQSLNSIAEKHPGEDVLVVTHCAFIKAFLSHIQGLSLREFWHPPMVENCSHTIVVKNPEGNFEIEQYAGLLDW
ncbi:histidine phosphatase family protein [Parasalinivibrio latis]|uniref:histidine phosphatase family protein n=1 Tax=Parasalinivibrio latis TaxID=2952610 RepID=UPI0030E22997